MAKIYNYCSLSKHVNYKSENSLWATLELYFTGKIEKKLVGDKKLAKFSFRLNNRTARLQSVIKDWISITTPPEVGKDNDNEYIWINANVWGRESEGKDLYDRLISVINSYPINKDNPVMMIVSGELSFDTYKNQQGIEQTSVSLNVDDFLIERRINKQGQSAQAAAPTGQSAQAATPTGWGQSAQAATPTGWGQPAQAAVPAGWGQPAQATAPTGWGQPAQTAAPTGQPAQAAAPPGWGQPAQTAAPTGQPAQTAAPTGQPAQAAAPTGWGQPAQTAAPTGQPAQATAPPGWGQSLPPEMAMAFEEI